MAWVGDGGRGLTRGAPADGRGDRRTETEDMGLEYDTAQGTLAYVRFRLFMCVRVSII